MWLRLATLFVRIWLKLWRCAIFCLDACAYYRMIALSLNFTSGAVARGRGNRSGG